MKDAKGHGSNKRGTHADGVSKIGTLSLHPNVLQTIRKNPDGFSVDPRTGKSPTGGYMVSIPGHSRVLPEGALHGPSGPSVVAQYARDNAMALKTPGSFIGGWTNGGKMYLDVSRNVHGKTDAIATGKKNNQIGIWDNVHYATINTGGTGKDKK